MKNCLINCHFGSLPNYLPFFIKSASTVECLDVFIMTNDPRLDEYNKFCDKHNFNNVKLMKYDVPDLERTVSENLNVSYKMPNVRKICDWKTAYNFLFPEITNNYDYWGHCDLDIIMGDVDGYLEPLLGKYDVISADRRRLCGPFNLYAKGLGNIFKLHPMWVQIMLHMEYTQYDEMGLDMAIKSENSISAWYGTSGDKIMQNYGSPHLVPPIRIPATWRDGKLTIDEDGRETMIIHMGHKAQIVNVQFNNGNFKINERGFSSEPSYLYKE